MEEQIKEIIGRMAKGEPGLHAKVVGDYKLVRTTTLPVLMVETLRADVKSKKLKVLKTIKRGKHKICILEKRR